MGSGRSNGSNKRSKSKRFKANSDGQEEEGVAPPSPKRWEEMMKYKSFLGELLRLEINLFVDIVVVKDGEGEDVKFEKDQV